jgi:tRNA (mo5U34)-methyltransferase
MNHTEIEKRIDSFPTWHYQFDLQGHKTPINVPSRVNGHEQRRRYFLEPLVRLCGGSLKGKRVLDLGCNAGYWSLHAAQAGADFVLGIDGRQMHVDQANLVFEVKEIDRDRYHFMAGDVYDVDLRVNGPFDVVLFLGLMYHVSKPVALVEKISEVNHDFLVIDTYLSIAPGSYLRVRSDNPEDLLHASGGELVMSPTKRAVVDIARYFGYEVAVLKPQFSDYDGARKYRDGRRRAFLCAKQTPLKGLDVPTERPASKSGVKDLAWLAADVALKRGRRLSRR